MSLKHFEVFSQPANTDLSLILDSSERLGFGRISPAERDFSYGFTRSDSQRIPCAL